MFVFPALLLENPAAVDNLFYRLAPGWALMPLVALATSGTVIASQAVISGAFSLTRQAVQLGYCPRLAIVHTSPHQIGQIYVPSINWILMVGTVCLVLGFRHSGNLAAAYGIAVSATMVIITVLMFFVAHRRWKWKPDVDLAICAVLLAIDLAFWASNITKVVSGGRVPLLVASVVFTVMATWKQGRRLDKSKLDARALPLRVFLGEIFERRPLRVPGTAIFLTGNPNGVPTTLVSNFRLNKILHERVILLNVATREIPRVPSSERIEALDLGGGFFRVTLHYGFSEQPDISLALKGLNIGGDVIDPGETTYFLGRENLLVSRDAAMAQAALRPLVPFGPRCHPLFRDPPPPGHRTGSAGGTVAKAFLQRICGFPGAVEKISARRRRPGRSPVFRPGSQPFRQRPAAPGGPGDTPIFRRNPPRSRPGSEGATTPG